MLETKLETEATITKHNEMKYDVARIINRFPKKRPTLSKEIKDIYDKQYEENRNGRSAASSLAQKLETWMHKKVSKARHTEHLKFCDTLEIGAGTLNQLPFENQNGNYDFIEPMEFLYLGSPNIEKTRNAYSDISDITASIKYHRIISVAVLEHIEDLPNLIIKCIEHMTDGGVFACGIPSEGGFLWGAAWRLSTGLEFRLRTGLNYSELMRYEHLNDADEIEHLLRYYFRDVELCRFGFGKHFSLYTYIECRNPKM